MEKHWKSVVSRSVCDYFFNQQRNISSPEDIPPVIATPHHYLISIYRSSMYFIVVCMTEGMLSFCQKPRLQRVWKNYSMFHMFRSAAFICDWIPASCCGYFRWLLFRMYRIDYKRELRGCLWSKQQLMNGIEFILSCVQN